MSGLSNTYRVRHLESTKPIAERSVKRLVHNLLQLTPSPGGKTSYQQKCRTGTYRLVRAVRFPKIPSGRMVRASLYPMDLFESRVRRDKLEHRRQVSYESRLAAVLYNRHNRDGPLTTVRRCTHDISCTARRVRRRMVTWGYDSRLNQRTRPS